MSGQPNKYPKDVFTSLEELLRMEHLAHVFSLSGKKHKVNTVLGGKHASKLRGRGLDFDEIRNYVKGDDIRNIDWKVTARTQVTHTRVFTEEKEKPALIVVDQSKSMFFGSQKRTKSVVAAELAALMAFRILKEGDRVGGVIFADEASDIIFPKRDRKNILRFLEKLVDRNRALASTDASSYQEVLKDTSQKIRNIVTHDFLVIVISDFIRYSPEVMKYLAQIAQHNDVVLAKVFDPMERELLPSKFVAGNEHLQLNVDGSSSNLRKDFQEGYDADLLAFQSQMKKHRIPVFNVNTVAPLEEQLKEIFKGGKR